MLAQLLAQSSGGAEILQSNKKKKKQQQVESVPLEPVVISKSMQRKLDALKVSAGAIRAVACMSSQSTVQMGAETERERGEARTVP